MKTAQTQMPQWSRQLDEPTNFPESEAIRRVSRTLPALRRKQVLVSQGDVFHGLYIVRCGMLKQSQWGHDGDEQITHFLLPGDVIGLDAIVDRRYQGLVTALETVGIMQIPFARIEDFPGDYQNHLQLLSYLSRAMQREHIRLRHMMAQPSDLRLARFFLAMSHNFKIQGYSSCRFRLPMSRCEIASYLNMAFETTSRLISRFQKMGIMSAKGHEYCIHDVHALKQVAESEK
ncbi:helix-turn-helix domain-containing protein [Halomonas sp. HP20-15]|uniref:helix-turn-helix domain-containing protein n=1 Tax=Halomonas sp. HP20-15 TaxID=3085901 RepID=UPI002981D445|nr:helix-turn-helix domain-containing protein [Halomonas sp. HP20-15]MDW5377912.1 helix-turn-helix domain-containing protein [Halomonas sp. HP20-15]